MWSSRLSVILKKLKKLELLNLAGLFSLLGSMLCLILRIWQHPLSLPFVYFTDALFSLMIIKNLVVNQALTINPNLGFPFGQYLADFPAFDTWPMVWVWLISRLTSNIFLIQNLFFGSTFFSIALSAYYVLRRLKLNSSLAIAGSLLFAFLPFHLLSNTNHLFLSDYSLVPLVILFTLELVTNQQVSLLPESMTIGFQKYLLAALALIIAASGIYYAVFSLFFLSLGLLFNLIKYQNLPLSKKALFIILIIGVSLISQLAPTIKLRQQWGSNQVASFRLPLEAELYSLKFNQLIFPLNIQWLSVFHLFKPATSLSGHLKGEGTEYLGIAGILGLTILLIWPMIKHFFHRSTQRLIAALSYLSILAILLSISTGVGTLLAYVLTSQIRVYARISPFIAFMCLTAFLLVVQTWWQKKLLAGLMIALITVSLIDQTVWYAPRTSVIQSGFNTDQNLVQQIEAGLPTGSAIFQLPYKAFPESAPIDQLEDYELLKPYLQSRQLNWSYAGIKGRPGDQWYQRVAGQPIDQLVVTIKEQGFAGILINRRGYSDQGRTIEASLSAVIKTPPIISQDKINIYYSLK